MFSKIFNWIFSKKITPDPNTVVYYTGNNAPVMDLLKKMKELQRPIGKVSAQICE